MNASTIAPICGDQDGSEQPLVFNCSQFSQVVDRRYYQVPGSGSVTVHFDYVYREAACNNELAVFRGDDTSGSINGVLPGDASWPTQVASRNPEVVFGFGSDASSADVNLTFQGGEILALGEDGGVGGSGGGDEDFNDMIVNVSAAGGRTLLPVAQTIGTHGGRGVHGLAPTATRSDDVDTLTGAFTTTADDLSVPGLGVPFDFARSYTSSDTTSGRLGPGWADSFSAGLVVQANGDVLLHGEDGQQIYYTKQADGSFVGASGALSTLSAVSGGYRLVTHDQVVYRFDNSGVLQSELDRNGQGLTFGYDGSGRLIEVTDAAGRTAILAYNAENLLGSITSSDGRTVSYGYTDGLLTSATLPDPDGSGPLTAPVTRYGYDSGRLATVVDPNNHTVVANVYDPATGRVTQQTDANGKVTTFAWDAATTTASTTDPNGHVWKDVYDSDNVLDSESDPGGDATQFSYDGGLDTGSVTSPDGADTTSLAYDGNHNLMTATAPASLGSVEKTFTYDAQDNVKSVTDAREKQTSYGYDAAGNNTSITLDGQQLFAAAYNAQGEMLTSTDGNDKTTTYAYDANGNVASVTDPLGNKTTYTGVRQFVGA